MKQNPEKMKRLTKIAFLDFIEEGETVKSAVARVIYELEFILKDKDNKKVIYQQLIELSEQMGEDMEFLKKSLD